MKDTFTFEKENGIHRDVMTCREVYGKPTELRFLKGEALITHLGNEYYD